MISNGELSDLLCDSVNRGLTLVRLKICAERQTLLKRGMDHTPFSKNSLVNNDSIYQTFII